MYPFLVFTKILFQGVNLHHVSFLCHCASQIGKRSTLE
jgi:hypothetical protein